jgi:prepilin-type N-terminal cleavage/methylation domain-containing protein
LWPRSRRPVPDDRRGLTIIEIVVVLTVLLILAAAVTPSVIGGLNRSRVSSSVETLQEITDAMSEMRADNQDWPGRVSHLATPITTSDANVCGNNYASGRVNNWAGPYLDRVVPSTGLPIGVGTVNDVLTRSNISGNDALLTIQVVNVSQEDAFAMNASFDNDGDVAGRTTGTLQWTTPTAEGLVTLLYYRPIRGC